MAIPSAVISSPPQSRAPTASCFGVSLCFGGVSDPCPALWMHALGRMRRGQMDAGQSAREGWGQSC